MNEPQQTGQMQNAETLESATQESSDAPTPETVAERIDSAIVLLEAEKHEEFVETFFVPEELESVRDSGKYEEVLRNFRRHNASDLLRGLRSIQGDEPTMSEDGKIAWFTTDETIASQNKFAFVKVNGVWYIPNRPPTE